MTLPEKTYPKTHIRQHFQLVEMMITSGLLRYTETCLFGQEVTGDWKMTWGFQPCMVAESTIKMEGKGALGNLSIGDFPANMYIHRHSEIDHKYVYIYIYTYVHIHFMYTYIYIHIVYIYIHSIYLYTQCIFIYIYIYGVYIYIMYIYICTHSIYIYI